MSINNAPLPKLEVFEFEAIKRRIYNLEQLKIKEADIYNQ